MRFTNIDFIDDFENPNSGVARKLEEQIRNDLTSALKSALGENFVGYEIDGYRRGSLILDGRVLSRDALDEASIVAAKLEETIGRNLGGQIGGNNVDLTALYVNGETTTAATTTRNAVRRL